MMQYFPSASIYFININPNNMIMKKLFLCFSVLAMLISSCQSDDDATTTPTPDERKDILLTRTEQEMTALGNEFAFKFFKTVSNNEKKENLFISPLSASLALSMTTNGAANNSLKEMKATLGFGDYSLEEMNEYYKKLVDGLLAVDNTTQLGIANSIWVNEGFPVEKAFIDANKKMYDAEVRNLNFFSTGAVDIINGWCSDKTNKRIPKVLEEISGDARLFLINALYFKGIWKSKFDKTNTKKEEFTTISGAKTTVDLMHQECTALYTSDEGIQIVELPYGNEAFSMVILLPTEEYDVNYVMEQLTPENWDVWMKRLYTQTVDVKLPKFKLEYDRRLNKDLMEMGMIEPFSPLSADFSNMSPQQLYIAFVQQNTFVEVNEEGTEAAAVTIIGMDNTAAPSEPQIIPFHVNRPFVFVIKEKSTGAILFMGKMGSV